MNKTKSPKEVIADVQERFFNLHKKWLEESGAVPMAYFFLHHDGTLESMLLPDGDETTKVAAARAITQYCARLNFLHRPPLATFLVSDTWLATVAPEEREPLKTPASERLNRREAVIIGTFTPESASITGRFYRREGRRIIWEEPTPDETTHGPGHFESRFDPWLSKRRSN